MDMQLVLNKLKKEYMNNANLVDVTHVEKIIVQIKNTTNTNKEQIGKTLSELKNARQKILELSESLRQMDASNMEISRDMTTLEEGLVSIERENWKYNQHFDSNRDRVGVLSVENKSLLCTFIEKEEEKETLMKKLSDLNKELETLSVFIDKILKIEKTIWEFVKKIQEKEREIVKVQKSVLDKEKYETASKDVAILTNYYKNRLKGIEEDKIVVATELEKWKVEYDALKYKINEKSSEGSNMLAKMFTVQCRKYYELFRQNLEDQELRFTRLTHLIKEESAINSRLTILLKGRTEENEELRDVTEDMTVEVKDEIISL